jgi:hypothetical protein
VNFSFDRSGTRDPIEEFMGSRPKTAIGVKVRVVFIDNETEVPISLQYYGPSALTNNAHEASGAHIKPKDIGHTIAHLESWSGSTAEMVVASFWIRRYGHYRAYVKTENDAPIMTNIRSELEIKELFNQGE